MSASRMAAKRTSGADPIAEELGVLRLRPAWAQLPVFDECVRSRKRLSTTMERIYRMPTPMGTFVIAYIETDKPFTEASAVLAASNDPFDLELVRRLADVHGADFSKAPPGPPPEVVGEWFDAGVRDRGRGLAFVAPLQPGKTAEGRAFAQAAFKERVKEFAASRRAKNLWGEVVVVNQTPHGDFVCVYLEGKDPVEGNRQFAASKEPFDVWFKGECRKIFPAAIDFNQPLPPIEQIHDWRA